MEFFSQPFHDCKIHLKMIGHFCVFLWQSSSPSSSLLFQFGYDYYEQAKFNCTYMQWNTRQQTKTCIDWTQLGREFCIMKKKMRRSKTILVKSDSICEPRETHNTLSSLFFLVICQMRICSKIIEPFESFVCFLHFMMAMPLRRLFLPQSLWLYDRRNRL